jgi:hypothetical protein
MRNKILFILLSISILAGLSCQEHSYDPWGPWNSDSVDITTARIRVFNENRYYMAWESGIRIMEDYNTYLPGTTVFPAIVEPGDYQKIEYYEKTNYGFLFTLTGKGYKDISNSKRSWQEDTKIQVKMVFISPDECRFEYISKADENGFQLSFLVVKENTAYRRYRVEE